MTNNIQSITDLPLPVAKYVGWMRCKGRKWWVMAEADTESECFSRLLDESRKAGRGHTDLFVGRRNEEPPL
jgi:hypothetical protein